MNRRTGWRRTDKLLILPVELPEKGGRAIDEVIEVVVRATVKAVLRMSAEQVAGLKEQGRRDADRELSPARCAGGTCGVAGAAVAGRQAAAAQEAAAGRRAGRVGDGCAGSAAGPAASVRHRRRRALRRAVGRVFGSSNLVQRCRNHKVRNVWSRLPKEQHDRARSTLRAAWKLDADEGPVHRLGLPKLLRRCLTATNIIDSSHAGIRQHTNRVSRR